MNQTTLCDAIRARTLIKFRYRDSLQERTFAPYIVYRTADGHLHLSGYSEFNPVKPLERHEWRNFEFDEISGLSITKEAFTPDATFDPTNKRYAAGIICHVKQNF